MSEQGRRVPTPGDLAGTARRVAAAARTRQTSASGRRSHFRRTRTLRGTLGLTALGTLVPGSGMVIAGRRALGVAVLVVGLVIVGGGVYGATHRSAVVAVAVDPELLLVGALLALLVLAALVAVSVLTYRMVRRPRAPRRDRVIEGVVVGLLCLVVAAPLVVTARYAMVQRDLVNTVFAEGGHPALAGAGDPEQAWGPDDRVNVLLLGGDGGVHRTGIRTDSVILASIDTETGDTVLFSLPRNLQEVPFPPGSELDQLYPGGFDGEGDPLEWMLNAVYGNVPEMHPEVVADAANPGAKAVKQAVSGALGIPVDYYVLVNLQGFQQVVDAIGGVTVNINQPIPIGGDTDRGIPPRDYLEPGPSQHLDGFEALWFARGRWGLTDYDRMERQRCVVDALMDEVEPFTLLRRYEELARAGKEIVRTDIPQALLSEFVELGLKLDEGEVRSVVFQLSDRFDPNDPDYHWVHDKVEQVLAAASQDEATGTPGTSDGAAGTSASPTPTPSGPTSSAPPTPTADASSTPTASTTSAAPDDPCGYHPVG